jgi:REP element-mobilizing transposase RayT
LVAPASCRLFFDYNSAVPTIRSRGRLPHWEADHAIYFVTFRLADSLPRSVLQAYKLERQSIVAAALAAGRSFSSSEQKQLEKLFREKIKSKLDAGAGRCYLAKPAVADAVAEALRHFDLSRYRLYAWCVMPNHVHALFRPLADHKLAGVVHSWKSYCANKANLLLGLSGDFWQREYYDHLVRSEKEFHRIVEYILRNPEYAGLPDWRWVGTGLP